MTRLYGRNCKQWKHKLEQIECPLLRIKVACIIFWDSTGDSSLEVKNNYSHYLLSLTRQWMIEQEQFYTEDDVMRALMLVAEYPMKGQFGAYKRSRTPIPHNGWRKRGSNG